MQVAREVEEARRAADAAPLHTMMPQPVLSDEPPLAASAEENVKSLSSARLSK
jgi:hypothetical protein